LNLNIKLLQNDMKKNIRKKFILLISDLISKKLKRYPLNKLIRKNKLKYVFKQELIYLRRYFKWRWRKNLNRKEWSFGRLTTLYNRLKYFSKFYQYFFRFFYYKLDNFFFKIPLFKRYLFGFTEWDFYDNAFNINMGREHWYLNFLRWKLKWLKKRRFNKNYWLIKKLEKCIY